MNKIKKEYKLIVPIIILVLIDQLLKFVILKVGNCFQICNKSKSIC